MAKPPTKTEVVTKAFARSGPEIRPDQIRLADEAQTDKSKVFTQTDVNQGMSDGGGADLTGYAKTTYVDSADNALNDLLAAETQARKDGDTAASYQLQQAEKGLEAKIEANTQAIEQIEIPEGGGSEPDPSLPYELVLGETDSTEIVSKSQSVSDGVAPAQILETIALKDSNGVNLGGIHFESASGIGVALSHRYENTILIQGAQLETKIEAFEENTLPLNGGTLKGVLSVKHGATGGSHVFSCYAAGLGEEQVAFRVTGDGSVKAGQDANRPFMAKANNDVVTKAYFFQQNAGYATKNHSHTPKAHWVAVSHKVAENLERGEFFIGDDDNIYFHRFAASNADVGVNGTAIDGLVFLCTVHALSGSSVHCMTADQISVNNGENKYSMVRKKTKHYGEGTDSGTSYVLNIPGFTF